MKELHGTTLPIRYIMNRECHRPIIIPGLSDAQFYCLFQGFTIKLYSISILLSRHIRKGTRVRIIGGVFRRC